MRQPLLVLISGAPGSGKTTLARRLADELRVPHINKDRIRDGLLFEQAGRNAELWTAPLDLGCPLINVNTTDGYSPSIKTLVRMIEES